MNRLLFVDSQASWRSLIAATAACTRGAPGEEVRCISVGSEKPDTAAVLSALARMGVAADTQTRLPSSVLARRVFDIVVALDNDAAAACLSLPGCPQVVNWGLPHVVPGPDGSLVDILAREACEINGLVEAFYSRGYSRALSAGHRFNRLLLSGSSDGVLVHDRDRRILDFSPSAEAITEYTRDDVLGRDCHDVFPGNFCGAKCLFCEGEDVPVVPVRREMSICTKSGETRWVDMLVQPMDEASPNSGGVVVSFHDITREQQLARRVGDIENFAGIVGRDDAMLQVFDLVHDLADSAVPVLIRGESGTGKELIAAAIHNEGVRAKRLFVPVNCGALPESLLESELFGHVKGAFTGAIRDKKGRFELADKGTIFLDEIGDISPVMQVKLLRTLQEGTFERVGGEETIKVDVRVISATNKDLEKEIEEGRFREDLYYRLNVVPVYVPPLRERRTDIPLLIDHVMQTILKGINRDHVTISDEARDVMLSYDWPGNVRELQNWLQFALVKCRGTTIYPDHLPPPRPGVARGITRSRGRLDVESVRSALQRTGNNRLEAARLLGVSRATLYRFLNDTTL